MQHDDDQPMRPVVSRRMVLAMGGGAAMAAFLASCSSDSEGTEATTSEVTETTGGSTDTAGRALAELLNARKLAGLKFYPITFTPTASKFAGKACHGVRIRVTDREALNACLVGVALARQLQLYGRVIPTEETVAKIASVTIDDVLRAARRIFRATPTLAVLGPAEQVPSVGAIAETLAA